MFGSANDCACAVIVDIAPLYEEVLVRAQVALYSNPDVQSEMLKVGQELQKLDRSINVYDVDLYLSNYERYQLTITSTYRNQSDNTPRIVRDLQTTASTNVAEEPGNIALGVSRYYLGGSNEDIAALGVTLNNSQQNQLETINASLVSNFIADETINSVSTDDALVNEVVKRLGELNITRESQQFGPRGEQLLKDIEALRLTPYDDQTGLPITEWIEGATIGYGYLISESEWNQYRDGITEAEADQLFDQTITRYVDTVNRFIKVNLAQNQFDALVLLAYNIGPRAFEISSAVKFINDPSYLSDNFSNLESAWKAFNISQGKVNQGLVNRRNAEWNIYANNVYERW